MEKKHKKILYGVVMLFTMATALGAWQVLQMYTEDDSDTVTSDEPQGLEGLTTVTDFINQPIDTSSGAQQWQDTAVFKNNNGESITGIKVSWDISGIDVADGCTDYENDVTVNSVEWCPNSDCVTGCFALSNGQEGFSIAVGEEICIKTTYDAVEDSCPQDTDFEFNWELPNP